MRETHRVHQQNAWEQTIMKRIVNIVISCLAFATLSSSGSIPPVDRAASCADCETDNAAGIRRTFNAFDENCRKLSDGNAHKNACFVLNIYNKVLPIMKALSKDNRFGPVERILLVGDTQSGSLTAGASRPFQSVAPLDRDVLNVEVDKTAGGGGALVKICSVDEAGSIRRIGTIKFDAGSETGTRSVSLTGVQGRMIRIDVVSAGGRPGKFQYTIRIS